MHRIIIQHVADKALVPPTALLRRWANQALSSRMEDTEVTIRIVGVEEMAELNEQFRHKKGPTNVLSFPFETPAEIELENIILGDIVICADVVNREANEQHKTREAHWAHMIIHGIFHLMGYDHENDKDAEKMEGLEIEMMGTLGFPNPYATGDDIKHYD